MKESKIKDMMKQSFDDSIYGMLVDGTTCTNAPDRKSEPLTPKIIDDLIKSLPVVVRRIELSHVRYDEFIIFTKAGNIRQYKNSELFGGIEVVIMQDLPDSRGNVVYSDGSEKSLLFFDDEIYLCDKVRYN